MCRVDTAAMLRRECAICGYGHHQCQCYFGDLAVSPPTRPVIQHHQLQHQHHHRRRPESTQHVACRLAASEPEPRAAAPKRTRAPASVATIDSDDFDAPLAAPVEHHMAPPYVSSAPQRIGRTSNIGYRVHQPRPHYVAPALDAHVRSASPKPQDSFDMSKVAMSLGAEHDLSPPGKEIDDDDLLSVPDSGISIGHPMMHCPSTPKVIPIQRSPSLKRARDKGASCEFETMLRSSQESLNTILRSSIRRSRSYNMPSKNIHAPEARGPGGAVRRSPSSRPHRLRPYHQMPLIRSVALYTDSDLSWSNPIHAFTSSSS
eukprot:m.80892 g.80892  ORF g.80892 m.80892 type:complete len:317 (+) comp8211_c0_seq3:360-1310(+)